MKKVLTFSLFIVLAAVLFIVGAGVGYAVAAQDWQAPLVRVGLLKATRSTPPLSTPLETQPLVSPETELPPAEETVFCPMDAQQCPDGSYVGRSGPNCEFEACPGQELTPEMDAKIAPLAPNGAVDGVE